MSLCPLLFLFPKLWTAEDESNESNRRSSAGIFYFWIFMLDFVRNDSINFDYFNDQVIDQLIDGWMDGWIG